MKPGKYKQGDKSWKEGVLLHALVSVDENISQLDRSRNPIRNG
jgi:hypothetical protein